MPHFYVKPEDLKEQSFSINGEQVHHILNVRRFKINDEIMIFDGLGNSYKAQIRSLGKNEIFGKILSSSFKMPSFKVDLYTAIPKGDRFEWLIEKTAEIGVHEVIPICTKRSVITKISKHQSERHEKISISASSQCGRNDIMRIHPPIAFKNACKNAVANKSSVNILSWESEDKHSVDKLFASSSYSRANIFVGPEGGFENEEVEFAKALGIYTVTLGENVLRTETAAVVLSTLVLSRAQQK
jgi:16S rRNA (uracil1498-N3)-methyltransferase